MAEASQSIDNGAPLSATVRESLRGVIANDSYAATFQSFGQYRSALLKHIDNLVAAEHAAQLKTDLEQTS